MIKYIYLDGTHCCRALHTVHPVYTNDEGKLVSHAHKADGSGPYEFEIKGFEVLQPGVIYS
jgi:hypothetical protein